MCALHDNGPYCVVYTQWATLPGEKHKKEGGETTSMVKYKYPQKVSIFFNQKA